MHESARGSSFSVNHFFFLREKVIIYASGSSVCFRGVRGIIKRWRKFLQRERKKAREIFSRRVTVSVRNEKTLVASPVGLTVQPTVVHQDNLVYATNVLRNGTRRALSSTYSKKNPSPRRYEKERSRCTQCGKSNYFQPPSQTRERKGKRWMDAETRAASEMMREPRDAISIAGITLPLCNVDSEFRIIQGCAPLLSGSIRVAVAFRYGYLRMDTHCFAERTTHEFMEKG